jgi:hypothetical protein
MLNRFLLRQDLLAAAFFCLLALSAFGQVSNAPTQITPGATLPSGTPAKPIGAAPANSPQHQILSSALSPETRQTLQQAMNSAQSK